MATHIHSIASSTIPKCSRTQFLAQLQFGDAVFCEGRYAVSKVIQQATGSCLSHILMAWLPGHSSTTWLTAESTADKGVHVGLLTDYLDKYDGDLAIVRFEGVNFLERDAMMEAFYGVLELAYNAEEEVTTALHKLFHLCPIAQPKKELYCSQLWKVMRAATSKPCGAGADSVNYTPEDAWLDVAMNPIAAYCK